MGIFGEIGKTLNPKPEPKEPSFIKAEFPSREKKPERETKPAPKPVSKSPVKELKPLSERGNIETKDLAWSLRSQRGYIYDKYRVTEKEIDKVVGDLKKYGFYVAPEESRPWEKSLHKARLYDSNIKKQQEAKKWEQILRDPKIFKKYN